MRVQLHHSTVNSHFKHLISTVIEIRYNFKILSIIVEIVVDFFIFLQYFDLDEAPCFKYLSDVYNTVLVKDVLQYNNMLSDEQTREREFGIYKTIEDNFPKYVLSLDRFDFSRDGIIHKNIIDFLIEWEPLKTSALTGSL